MKLIHTGMLSGGYSCKIYLDFTAYDSSVEFPSDDEPYCKIRIGCAYNDWGEIYDGILHELMEFHMTNMELAYQRWYRVGCDSGDIWFNMSHAEYSECISRAAQSILVFVDKAKKEVDNHIKKLHTSTTKSKKIIKEDTSNENNKSG